MSSKPNALVSTIGALANVNAAVNLGLQVGTLVIPLVKGLIKEIRSIGGPGETVSYEIVVSTDQSELDDIKQLSMDDLTAIAAELARMGKPSVSSPPTPQPPTTA